MLVWRWTRRFSAFKSYVCLGSDNICYALRQQQQCRTILAPLQQGHNFASKTADFTIRQDRLQPIAHFNTTLAIVYGKQDQDTAIAGFGTDAPGFIKIRSVALDVSAIERMNRNDGNLRVGLLVNLLRDAADSFRRRSVKYSSEVIDISCGLKLADWLG